MSVAELLKKVGGRKFLLGLVGTGAVTWLTAKGVPPEAAWPIVAAVLGAIGGIAAEDVMKARATISSAALKLDSMAAATAKVGGSGGK